MLGFRSGKRASPADSEALDALWLLRWLPNTGNTALARFLLDIHGEVARDRDGVRVRALQAIGEGFRRVRYGSRKPYFARPGILAFPRRDACMLKPMRSAGTLCRRKRPALDEARDGFVPGEGGAAFSCLNPGVGAGAWGGGACGDPRLWGFFWTRAAHRARRIGPLCGAGGTGALADAGLEPHAVDCLAHGTVPSMTGVRPYCWRGFCAGGGESRHNRLKSWIGHGSAACGGMELALMSPHGDPGSCRPSGTCANLVPGCWILLQRARFPARWEY